ncbi:MAG: zincin-like metallopeptidase domain-containing protein [Sphingobacteriales bacterium JAD_PAG50586_3]|nr:MAG: zincin-like metallopeptidase domain-containing protein [Sphingobacteriales bacterium JAD_PAG50586_3]
MTVETTPKTDIYTTITNKIIADLEKGNLTWRKPWDTSKYASKINRPLRWNNIPYTGINTIMLWATAADNAYTSEYWMTFNQAKELGGGVIKGEKGATVVYADKMTKEEENEAGEKETKQIPFLKTYTVFNANQIEGLPEEYYKPNEQPVKPLAERIEALEEFFAATKANIVVGGDKAAYFETSDKIHIPHIMHFATSESYYATLAHELTHWTKHPNRLNRDFGRKKWGDIGYAKEELVAELGSCFLSADLGLHPHRGEESAAYIQSWLEVLKNDKKFIFTAASFAQRAVEYINCTISPSI